MKLITLIIVCFGILSNGCLPKELQADQPPVESTVLAKTALADAVQAEDRDRIGELLDSPTMINASQADGTTALHWAVFHQDSELVAKLISAGARVDSRNHFGVAALSLACVNGDAASVSLLLDAGADANTVLPGKETALMTASRTGRLDCVQLLVERGATIAAEERNDQTAIMWAAADGHVEVVNYLIAQGADFEKELSSGFSPLMLAVRNGRPQVVQALIAAGADVNQQMNPEHKGGRHPRRAMSALHLAIENGHYELAEQLLELGADPNDQRCGFTPLHNLTWVRKPPRGDNVDGAPPPIGSGNMTSLEFIRVLVEHGADVDARLKKGSSGRGKMAHKGATPFLFAARRDDLRMMKTLLELGADPTIPNAENCTPLMVAAGIGSLAPGEEAGTEEEALEAVEWLLKLGADVNHVDDNGETAMHGAVYKSLPRMVNLLAVRGADVKIWNQKNKYGWTPTLIAEGHRVGNFKPAASTLNAVYRQLRANGIEPPPKTPRVQRKGYDQP
ncbi:MAG: ankyrin repeat domain-containing protein [Pirellulaceae bacterium]